MHIVRSCSPEPPASISVSTPGKYLNLTKDHTVSFYLPTVYT
jgi:hypothetical protein